MKTLAGLDILQLQELLPDLPRYRISQIYGWILKGKNRFEDMSNIPSALQKELSQNFNVFSSSVINRLDEADTVKIALQLHDKAVIEAVLLSDGKKRLTACLSTQAGCPAMCVFCKTGSLGFKRNLESAEIIEQFLHLRNTAGSGKKDGHIIDNIVIMGMGEPLLNISNLRKAVEILCDKKGLNLSLRRITVSTCGIYDGILDIAKNGPFFKLALSLVTADENLRRTLMPVTNSNPLNEVKKSLLLYQKNGGGRITLEIPLLAVKETGGINTSVKDASCIADFAKELDTVINIIPWNPVEGLKYENKDLCEPDRKETENFIKALESHKLKVTVRLHKGKKISGACGQLGVVSEAKK
ncbi:MAG: 23S rRNA (adenine(2503)-C(2))-methyltransferase RlmN [Treponema sp.]|nr:23S rRNA (adenine(2503)-C(2))-methyltransferase RlmN [Treponema sp.]